MKVIVFIQRNRIKTADVDKEMHNLNSKRVGI